VGRGLVAPLLIGAAAVAGALLPGAAGAALLYPALGFLPGAALMRLLPLGQGKLAQAALSIAIAPLVATVAAWLLISAGLGLQATAWSIAALSGLLWLTGRLRDAPATLDSSRESALPAALVALAGAGAIALIFFENPVIQIHSDGWIHAGIIAEILTRGIPPQDPRFAGMSLNYVWFYNFFIALLSSLRAGDPLHFMALFNAWNMGATLLVSWVAGRALWGPPAGFGTAVLTALGFNAGAWMLWPLHLIRGLVGEHRGWDGIADAVHRFQLNDYRVIFTFSVPFGYMVNFYDKFLVGTAVNYAYLMLSVYLASMVLWFGSQRRAALALAALAAAGMLLFHGVVGLSAIPVALGALGLTWLLSLRFGGLAPFGRIAAFAAATLAGSIAATPYTWTISRGWAEEKSGLQHSYFGFDPFLVWTLVIAIAAVVLFARAPLLRGWRERRADVTLLACFALGMALFTCVIKLPNGNHVKFIYQTFLPLALIGGVAWGSAWTATRRRLGPARALALFGLIFAVGPLLTLRGYWVDTRAATTHVMNLSPSERALYAWISRSTPADAVFIDSESRDYIMVLGRRQLLAGTRFGPELAAFPIDQLTTRRAVIADLYGAQRDLPRDIEVLSALARPVYVLYRTTDHADAIRPWLTLGRHEAFERAYDEGGFVVYHMRPPAPSTDPESHP
jgi:hypothetical protein